MVEKNHIVVLWEKIFFYSINDIQERKKQATMRINTSTCFNKLN